MQTVIDTITSFEDRIAETLEGAQEPVVSAVSRLVEQVEGFLPEDRPTLPFADLLPDPAQLVDTQFAFAKRLLESQHQLTKALLEAVAPLYGTTPAPVAKPAAVKTTKVAAA